MAGLDQLTVGSYREQQLLVWSALICGAVVWALHRQLRYRLGWVESAALCAARLIALVWAPPRTVLQPEWYAIVTAVAAIAVASARPKGAGRSELALATICGLLLTLTVLMKWTTGGRQCQPGRRQPLFAGGTREVGWSGSAPRRRPCCRLCSDCRLC